MLRKLPHTLFSKISRFFLGKHAKTLSYQQWLSGERSDAVEQQSSIIALFANKADNPYFTIIIDARVNANLLNKTIKSVNSQSYCHFSIRSFESRQQLKELVSQGVSGDFAVFLKSGQLLSHHALLEFAKAIQENPECDLVYGDHDTINCFGRRSNPFYKPDWSPDYLETFNYIGFSACFRVSVARELLMSESYYDFVLKFTEKSEKIHHIRHILGHEYSARFHGKIASRETQENIAALQGRLRRTGRRGVVREHQFYKGCYEIDVRLKTMPLVSIVITTAGVITNKESRQIDLIVNLVTQIKERSTYKNIEIIVVDNGDLLPQQQKALAKYGCKQVTFSEEEVNISRKLNLGASNATGELLLLMNDDIEIITPDWIERMAEHFEKPHVGVVGAKLLYPSGLIQHAGVAMIAGYPDHVRRKHLGSEKGYFFSTCGVRNFSAVTGAVMMTRAKLYQQLGGYNENIYNGNDTGYCFKARGEGYTVVCAPRATLIHMESETCRAVVDARKDEKYEKHMSWFVQHWADRIAYDPYYNVSFLATPNNIPNFEVCFKNNKKRSALSKQLY